MNYLMCESDYQLLIGWQITVQRPLWTKTEIIKVLNERDVGYIARKWVRLWSKTINARCP